MNQLLTDVRSGVRMLVKYPTLSLVAILTLGLGIGLSTTVFCVVNGGLFKGLPFPDADRITLVAELPKALLGRIVAVVATNPTQNQPQQPISAQDLAIWQERQTSFDKFGAYWFAPVNLSTEGERPQRYSSGQLTVAAFEALGAHVEPGGRQLARHGAADSASTAGHDGDRHLSTPSFSLPLGSM